MIRTLKDITPFLYYAALALLFLPFVSHAQTIKTILTEITGILNTVIPILMILGTLIFLWGIITYITAAGDEEKLGKAKTYIIWGLIGLFVMVSVWGLVQVLTNQFSIGRQGTPLGPLQ